jgi:hemoglobin
MTTDAADRSLFDRLGGAPALETVTTKFYRLVLADDMLAPYFDGIDMDRLIRMQAAFLAMAFGGPSGYAGRDLRAAHQGLAGLGDQHFDRVVALLASALQGAGVTDENLAAVAAVAETVRADVLGR